MKEIVQHAIIHVVQRQVVRYTCDRCGTVCGTRENPKSTWHQTGFYQPGSRGGEKHYCLRTCHPSQHPIWVREHVLACSWCYADAEARGETWMREALLNTLAGNGI